MTIKASGSSLSFSEIFTEIVEKKEEILNES